MARQRPGRKWSAQVTETSDALDLEEEVFKSHNAKRIAASLKHSAEHSHRRKASPFQSAMSMLTFYINRAGKKPLRIAKTRIGNRQERVASPVRRCAMGLTAHGKKSTSRER